VCSRFELLSCSVDTGDGGTDVFLNSSRGDEIVKLSISGTLLTCGKLEMTISTLYLFFVILFRDVFKFYWQIGNS